MLLALISSTRLLQEHFDNSLAAEMVDTLGLVPVIYNKTSTSSLPDQSQLVSRLRDFPPNRPFVAHSFLFSLA